MFLVLSLSLNCAGLAGPTTAPVTCCHALPYPASLRFFTWMLAISTCVSFALLEYLSYILIARWPQERVTCTDNRTSNPNNTRNPSTAPASHTSRPDSCTSAPSNRTKYHLSFPA